MKHYFKKNYKMYFISILFILINFNFMNLFDTTIYAVENLNYFNTNYNFYNYNVNNNNFNNNDFYNNKTANDSLFLSSINRDYIFFVIPSSNYYFNLFENLFLTTIPLIEETGGFSFIDFERFSINGNSYLWNKWFLEGFDITDPLFPGSSAFKVPYSLIKNISIYDFMDSISNGLIGNSAVFINNIIGGNNFRINNFKTNNVDKINDSIKEIFEKKKSYLFYNINFNYYIPFVGKNIEWTAYIDDFIAKLNIPSFLLGPFPVERDPPPPEERRRLNSFLNFNFDLQNYYKKNEHFYFNFYNIDLVNGKRQFLDFNYDGSFRKLFYENFVNINLFYKNNRYDKVNDITNNNIINFAYTYRDKLFAQQHYSESETATLKSFTFLYAISLSNNDYNLILNKSLDTKSDKNFKFNEFNKILSSSILTKVYSINHNNINFTREIIDPDGEGLKPFYADGKYYTLNFRFNLNNNLDFNNIFNFNNRFNFNNKFDIKNRFDINNKFNLNNSLNNSYKSNKYKSKSFFERISSNYFLNLEFNLLFFYPDVSEFEHLLTYNLNDYGKVKIVSDKSFNFYGKIDAGINNRFDFDFILINFSLYSGFNYYFNDKLTNSLFFLNYEVNINIDFFKKNIISPFINFSIKPVDINSNLALLLNPNYLNIYHYIGDETNGYSLIDTTGGKFLSVADNIKQPYIYSLNIGTDIKISENWKFKIDGIAKLFKNMFWILFKDDNNSDYYTADNYGSDDGQFNTINNYNVFFYNILNDSIRDYILTNYDSSLIGGGKYFSEPFYAGVKIVLTGYEDEKWFVNISFAAYLSMAVTTFGNGFVTNDIGNIDFSMANPDTWINGYGRVDNDRAYVGKGVFGFKLFGFLWNSLTIKYRDGQSFAFYGIYENLMSDGNEQAALLYNSIQAENEIGLKGGPREDSLWNFDYKISINDFIINIPFYKENIYKEKKNNYSGKNSSVLNNKDKVNNNVSENRNYLSLQINFSLTFVNFLDLANELAENVFSGGSRASLELEIPGSIVLELKIEF